MKPVPYTENLEQYLAADETVDFNSEAVRKCADMLAQTAENETAYVRAAYEYVRDAIGHSADENRWELPCSASEVLEAGHGVCFAKAHLLAALLRRRSIPAGFCYQKLILDDETAPVLIFHGLNGVYLREYKKWVRLDARGNKNGVNAQFSLEKEALAFPVRPEMGEMDDFTVYPVPAPGVLEKLRAYRTRPELWADLPTALGYGRRA